MNATGECTDNTSPYARISTFFSCAPHFAHFIQCTCIGSRYSSDPLCVSQKSSHPRTISLLGVPEFSAFPSVLTSSTTTPTEADETRARLRSIVATFWRFFLWKITKNTKLASRRRACRTSQGIRSSSAPPNTVSAFVSCTKSRLHTLEALTSIGSSSSCASLTNNAHR